MVAKELQTASSGSTGERAMDNESSCAGEHQGGGHGLCSDLETWVRLWWTEKGQTEVEGSPSDKGSRLEMLRPKKKKKNVGYLKGEAACSLNLTGARGRQGKQEPDDSKP